MATPTAPFPPTPTGMIMAAAATPRNSNTTDEPSASFPQDEGEVSTVLTTDRYRVTMVVANMPGWVRLTTILVIPLSAWFCLGRWESGRLGRLLKRAR